MQPTLALIVCAAALLSCAAAQEPMFTQEPAPTKESITTSLEGKVVKDPGGEPVKKAIIELVGEDQQESGNYTATSDQEGHRKVTGFGPVVTTCSSSALASWRLMKSTAVRLG